MPEPNTAFALIVATLIGALFHLILGGRWRRLLLFLLVSWVGFGAGDAAGRTLGVTALMIGDLHLATAIIGTLFLLFLTHVFTSGRAQPRRRRITTT